MPSQITQPVEELTATYLAENRSAHSDVARLECPSSLSRTTRGEYVDVVTPTLEELASLRKEVSDGPVVMVNLIKFREPDGLARFGDYSRLTAPLLEKAGTEIVYAAQAGPSLSGVDWDLVALVKFPNIDAFIEMIGSPLYQNEAGPLRKEALERTVWLVTQP